MNWIYKILIVLCLISVITSMPVLAKNNKLPFADVFSSSWYYDEVATVYDEGIMEGKTPTSFDPTAKMSRAEFVTVLARLSGEDYDDLGDKLNFMDTDKNSWYADYVAWGVETEMVKGLPGNQFAPNQAVSRQEMAVFIDRFVSYMNVESSNNAKVDSFGDTDKVADYAVDAVESMRISGIITGDEKGNFNPQNNASRAEVATVITRILPLLDNHGVIIPPDIDRENFDIQKAFLYGDKIDDVNIPYRIYFPEDYSEEKEYPVLLYVGREGQGTDNVSQLKEANILFVSNDSPAFDSIVIVPQAPISWDQGKSQVLVKIMDYVNENYSTDSERQYVIGADFGCWPIWHMINEFPNEFSAVIFLSGPTLPVYDIGYLPEDINKEMLDMSINLVYSVDDIIQFNFVGYGEEVYEALKKEGASNIVFTGVTGYAGDYCNRFVSEDDISLLEWLFAQRRETK